MSVKFTLVKCLLWAYPVGLNMKKLIMYKSKKIYKTVSSNSAVVERWPHYHKVNGSNPDGIRMEKRFYKISQIQRMGLNRQTLKISLCQSKPCCDFPAKFGLNIFRAIRCKWSWHFQVLAAETGSWFHLIFLKVIIT